VAERRYLRLADGDAFPTLHGFAPFKAVVLIGSRPSADWQRRASQWLVASGCLYAMAWGDDCGSWDDSIDHANLERFDHGEVPDDASVMTTWHDDQSFEEVIWFAKHGAIHPTVAIENVLFLDVGPVDRPAELETLYRDV